MSECKLSLRYSRISRVIRVEFRVNFENVEKPELVSKFRKHHRGTPIRRLRFQGNQMITAAKTVKITDLETEKVIRTIANDKVKIYSLLIADEYLLCVGDDKGYFKVWDYRTERPVHMELLQCEEYISDLDIDSDCRIVLATSGEGTLTAFNIRARRMEEPQSELFESGFQCVRFVAEKSKIAVGCEDGVINIFNHNEWGNISDRYPIKENSTGLCSIDRMECLDEDHSAFVIGCSDGSLEAFSLFPHQKFQPLSAFENGIESLDVNQITKKVVATTDNVVQLFNYDICTTENLNKKRKPNSEFFAGLQSQS